MIQITRRHVLKSGAAAGAVTGLGGTFGASLALAQNQGDIVIGSSLPVTGVFANTGVEFAAAMADYCNWRNENGGISGRKLRFVWEDSAYKTDQSVAVFRKISASDNPPFYYGDSTGWSKAVAAEVSSRGTMLTSAPSFSSDLADPEKVPYYFMSGPTYAAMLEVLLRYIKSNQKGSTAPSVALIYSDTEFGRDPIAAAKAKAQALGLPLAAEIMTKPGGVDVSAEVIKLRRAKPDYVIFHGYVLAPIPEFMRQIREAGLDPTFMGTIWTMDKLIIDQMKDAADGFTGVMPYRYYYDTDGAPAMKTIQAVSRKAKPDSAYRTVYYVHAWLTMMIYEEIAKRLIAAGKPFDGPNMKAALEGIENWDTGGIIGLPVSLKTHSIPIGRVYRANGKTNLLDPVSDWIKIG